MRTKLALIVTSSCLLLWLSSSGALAQFTGLVKHVPGTANTIILLNVEKILDSDLAKKEGWRENFEKSVEAGLVRMPADTLQYVLASQIDFGSEQPVWELGILKTSKPHSMSTAADKLKGTLDNIAGQEAIMLAGGSYIVQFDHRTFGALMPASRQAVSRWVRGTEAGPEYLSPYMKEAISFAEKVGTEIIMAIDLKEVLNPNLVQERLKEFESVSKQEIDVAKVAEAVMSIRGVTLGITLGEKPYGSIKLDFANDVTALDGIAGGLFVEVLKRNHAMLDDFEEWKSQIGDKQIRFNGYLSESGMRRIFSLIEAPVSDAMIASDEEPQTNDGNATEEDVAYATQKYFRSVTDLMDEFRHRDSPQRIAQIGLWLDKYARKIDRLPMVNVDKEMLDFGAYVSQQYRNAATAIKGIGIRSRVRSVNASNNTGYGYYGPNYYNGGYAYNGYYYRGGYGYGYGVNNAMSNYTNARNSQIRAEMSARTQVKVQEKAMGAQAARAIMQDVENATQEVRRRMVDKYKIEF
jgi:hypothetical protein